MQRKALLISNAGEENAENYCRGVFVDTESYRTFLSSPLGGAWFSSEIIHLDRPTCRQVKTEVSNLRSADYSLILFSGHGYFSESRETTIIELRKNEEYDSIDLRDGAIKRTIILDCCRKVYPEVVLEKAILAKMAAKAEILNFNECRKYFDATLEKCAPGIVAAYSCSKNEVSGDGGSRGGFYASSLLKATNNWLEQSNVDLARKYAPYSIVRAHNSAIPLVARLSGGTQNPHIEKPRSEPYFPFAIMA